jgi:hypothetical protein
LCSSERQIVPQFSLLGLDTLSPNRSPSFPIPDEVRPTRRTALTRKKINAIEQQQLIAHKVKRKEIPSRVFFIVESSKQTAP